MKKYNLEETYITDIPEKKLYQLKICKFTTVVSMLSLMPI